jgi:hypothetical protein
MIDGSINALAASVADWASTLRRTQTGYVVHYAFAMLIAITLGLGLLLWRVV